MTDSKGVCVVLLPGPNKLPDTVEGGQHITLAYLGDEPLSVDDVDSLLEIVSEMANSSEPVPSEIQVLGEDHFGENGEAHVVALDSSPRSPAVMLRKRLLGSFTPELMTIFQDAKTYPDYRAHMTLGYADEGYIETPIDLPDTLPLYAIAVWDGDTRIVFPIKALLDDSFMHYGTARKSGRYPWGSGDNPSQRNKTFLTYVDDLHKKGLSDVEIAKGMGLTTTELRARKSIAKTDERRELANRVRLLKERDYSNVAIGKELGINESSVRALLDPSAQERNDILGNTAARLKEEVADKKYLDIGSGTANHLDVSSTMLSTAVAMLEAEGYTKHYLQVEQLGTGKKTSVKVLAPPDTTFSEVYRNQDKIRTVTSWSEDGGRTFKVIQEPLSVDPKRIDIRYGDQGGSDADGVIYVRPGVKDLDMGNSRYSQVRIAVDGTHYLKGMAIYKDDLPAGVDLVFNTNKKDTGNKLDAMKPMKDDPDNPFGALVRQIGEPDGKGGKRVTSALNIVNDESDWDDWSRNLASQMLSKQTPALAKQQLALKAAQKQADLDEIMSLTNPTVRKKLLESFADSADSSAVHLKAAPLPGQKTHVILPINSLKDDEIYAPQYRNGDRVVLIRYPHGGTFEIPELTVNNRNADARKAIGTDVKAAVGINAKVAQRLSGADFDGDTVLVIPNNNRTVKTSPPLEGLKNFDPQAQYRGYPGMKVMSSRTTQREMGGISNLITDMTIMGAPHSDIVRAVRHSMVVIDAQKHKLDYKQSAKDNGISELKIKYQKSARAGASTIISRAGSEERVPLRKDRPAAEGGPIDKATGERRYVPTGETYTIPAHTRTTKTGKIVHVPEEVVTRKFKSTKMAETRDARTLVSSPSGTPMEFIYADHANKLKSMANTARKAAFETPPLKTSPSARVVYKKDVDSLNAKLNVALKNSPLERQAQLLANATLAAKKAASPDLEPAEIKKLKGIALTEARMRVGAKKPHIKIEPSEWEAIQAGAISNNKLGQILNHADLDQVKKLALPRTNTVMSTAVMARAKAMANSGYTPSEIADALGVATSTLNDAMSREES